MASSDKQILTYSILGVEATIDSTLFTIELELPYSTDITALVPTFTSSNLATVDILGVTQESGVTSNDFTNTIVYTVTAEDLSTNDYTVVLDITDPSTKKELKSFEIESVSTGLISVNSIQLKVNEGTDVTALTPTIEVSEFATVVPASGEVQDFTTQIEYTVTAEDLSTSKYLASVVYLPNHNSIYSVWDFLLANIPFIEDSTYNKNLASKYTIQVMWDLENCFDISENKLFPERLGNELYYNVAQKGVIADVIAMQFVYRLILQNMAGNNQQTDEEGNYIAPSQKFLSKAKAGSVESAFEQFTVKDSSYLALDTSSLLANLKADVTRKLAYQGCVYDINEFYELCAVSCSVPLSFGVSG